VQDLFEAQADRARAHDPLPERMRPRTLGEVLGQQKLVGPGAPLRALIEADRVPSLVLWGPPGVGKTTLAEVIAAATRARFVRLSAVLSGVAELRAALEEARRARGQHGARTILFVDEIHRWSKSQQDALLPAVERGVVTLVGATTENPSFELNAALLSRARVFVLEAIAPATIVALLRRALEDTRGLGGRVAADDDALALLARTTQGDARRALSALELAADQAIIRRAGADPRPTIRAADIEAALQHRPLLYDKAGAEHYGVVSAFIKSMRGSDPDAAVYYLVRMLEAGEDPRFVLRRLVIFASEDVGNADPQALVLATAALQAYELVGLPEGVLPLTQAVTYLATAPKSNAALTAYAAARKDVRAHGALPVPPRLLNPTSGLGAMLGHGRGYKYPHDLGGIAPGEAYLPSALLGRRYYGPREGSAESARLAAVRAAEAELLRAHPDGLPETPRHGVHPGPALGRAPESDGRGSADHAVADELAQDPERLELGHAGQRDEVVEGGDAVDA
jgi:putative ATPase